MSQDILLTLIDADPEQPRRFFDPAALAELAQSIGANGQAVPILLRPGAAGRYVIVHGERRYRAVQSLGWAAIRADVRNLAPSEARWLALAENVQRADLTPIEEADAYRAALADGVTQTELGRRLGKSQSYIATKLRLLRLPEDVRQAVDRGAITEGHAKQLLRLTGEAEQSELAQRAVAEDWPVQRLKLEVDTTLTPPEPEYEVHKLGQIFPMVNRRELASIADSIKQIGLIEPITLYEGQILDGKIRYAACKAAGVKPRFRVFPDDYPNYRGSALDFVLSANLYRKSISADQRAVIAAELLTLTEYPNMELALIEANIEHNLADLRRGAAELSKIPPADVAAWSNDRLMDFWAERFGIAAVFADGTAKAGELRDQLDRATTVGEAVSVASDAAALQNDMAEVTLHCERRAGQLLGQLQGDANSDSHNSFEAQT